MKWHRMPYGQKPVEWNVRHRSVLYFGCLDTVRSSATPWANWHLSPYLHEPFSEYVRHISVLYRSPFDDPPPTICCCCESPDALRERDVIGSATPRC
jgi:hypothetical protein